MEMKQRTPITVKLTAEELLASGEALAALESIELPSRTAYWIGKAMKRVKTRFKQVDKHLQEDINAIIREIGEPVMVDDGEGGKKETGQHQVPPTKHEEFRARRDALFAVEHEIEVTQIPLSALSDAKLASGHAGALEWLLVDE